MNNAKGLRDAKFIRLPLTTLLTIGFTLMCTMPVAFGQDSGSAEPEASGEELAGQTAQDVKDTNSGDDERFAELVERAQQQFASEEYQAALELYLKAYELQSHPNLLFNIGLSYEKLGNLEEAKARYKKFIVAPNVDLSARQYANTRVDMINEILASQEKDNQKQQVQNEQPRDSAPSKPSDATAETKPAAPEPPPESPPEPEIEYDYTWTYLSLGASAAFLAGGGAFYALAQQAGEEVGAGETAARRRESKDSAQTYALVSDSLFGVGAVFAGAALYTFFTANPVEAAPKTATILPQVGSEGAGVQVRWEF